MSNPEFERTVATTEELAGRRTAGVDGRIEHTFVPGQEVGHYRLETPLGMGGFGVVWLAVDLRLERPVAIKFLTALQGQGPAARALLEAEARAVASLGHPGIVTLHALEEADGHMFLVMERIVGSMLTQHLRPEGMPLETLLDLALQITEALAAAHDHGIIHRDLNPRNVMVTCDGRTKILDFGLALRNAAVPLAPLPGRSGNGPTGTIPYMSPEQLEGRVLDGRSDLFSLGVMLYEMATGHRPFRGEHLKDQIRATLEAEPEWPDTLHSGLAAVLRRCLEKEPSHRYPSAAELIQALRALRKPSGKSDLPSIAVLPFTDLSPALDEAPFCEGVAEEVLMALSRASGLRVLSRTSSFLYRGAALDATEIGRRLGVSTLLAGSVRKEGHRLRISAELTEVATGLRLWADRYDRERADVFQVQEEIAEAIAGALRLRLQPSEAARPSVDLEAYEDYLRGRHYYFRYQRQNMRFALQMFQQALSRDPGFAHAWAGIAGCAAFLYIYADRSEANLRQADEASRKALELDPNLAEAHASRGVALSAQGRAEEANAAFERALELDPNLYEGAYLYARHALITGENQKAVELFERAATLRPEDYQAPTLASQIYLDLGQPEAAADARRRGLARAEERLRHAPDDVRARYMGANALIGLGEREKGLAWARLARSLDPDDPMLLYNLGCIHALAGNPEEALDCLEQSVRAGLSQKAWFKRDNDLDSVRQTPRFQALMASMDACDNL